MQLTDIRQLVTDDFQAVNRLILEQLHTQVDFINELSHHLIDSGGKRLRPLLVLLSAKACHYEGEEHVRLAAIIEFIHTATLMHDDVVDNSTLRRGRETVNAIWGNQASVLVGDFLYSRAFQMMTDIQTRSADVIKVLADTTNTIAEGEVLQLVNQGDLSMNEARYRQVIYHKTAKLFEAGSLLGAIIAKAQPNQCSALAAYGKHLGNAFQLVDDALDYCAESDELGKNIGDDLAEGKLTLPLIYLLEHGNNEQQTLVRNAISQKDLQLLPALITELQNSGATDYVNNAAEQEIAAAIACLDVLPQTPFKQALHVLAEFAVTRNY